MIICRSEEKGQILDHESKWLGTLTESEGWWFLIEVELLIKVNFLRSRLFTFLDHALFYILVYFMVIKVVFEYHFEAFIKIKVLLNLGWDFLKLEFFKIMATLFTFSGQGYFSLFMVKIRHPCKKSRFRAHFLLSAITETF